MAKPFWRNVVVITLAHVALVAGLIRWSVAARPSSNAESIMWLGNAGVVASGEQDEASSPSEHASSATEPLKHADAEEGKTAVTTAKSEIELPSPTPKRTATATPTTKPAATPTQNLKPTAKPVRRPTPKKTLLAKASPKPKINPHVTKPSDKSEESKKNALANNKSRSENGTGETGSTGKGRTAGGAIEASEFRWYGDMLHDRFYRAWIQPTTKVATSSKISTLVKVRIESDGRVSKFEVFKPSGNVEVDESVRVVAKQVTRVDPPPTGLTKGDHYDVKINFELNTEEKTED